MSGSPSFLQQGKRQTAELLKAIPGMLAECTSLQERMAVLKLQTKMMSALGKPKIKTRVKKEPKSSPYP